MVMVAGLMMTVMTTLIGTEVMLIMMMIINMMTSKVVAFAAMIVMMMVIISDVMLILCTQQASRPMLWREVARWYSCTTATPQRHDVLDQAMMSYLFIFGVCVCVFFWMAMVTMVACSPLRTK